LLFTAFFAGSFWLFFVWWFRSGANLTIFNIPGAAERQPKVEGLKGNTPSFSPQMDV
jgi:hypothetical protein